MPSRRRRSRSPEGRDRHGRSRRRREREYDRGRQRRSSSSSSSPERRYGGSGRKKEEAKEEEEEEEEEVGGVSLTAVMRANPTLTVPEALAKLQVMKQMSGMTAAAMAAMSQTTPIVPLLSGASASSGNLGVTTAAGAADTTAGASVLAAAAAQQAAASKAGREVFVGGVPKEATASQVSEFLNASLSRFCAATERPCHRAPVVNAWLSLEGGRAFVETRGEDETDALVCLDGIRFGPDRPNGRPPSSDLNKNTTTHNALSIGRPRGAEKPTTTTKGNKKKKDGKEEPFSASTGVATLTAGGAVSSNYVVVLNVPRHLTESEILASLLLPLGPVEVFNLLRDETGASKGTCLVKYRSEKPATTALVTTLHGTRLADEIIECQRAPPQMIETLLKKPKKELAPLAPHDPTDPSTVVCLRNVVKNDDLADDEAFAALNDDVLEESAAYAQVESIEIPRAEAVDGKVLTKKKQALVSGLGLCFIEFASKQDAARALQKLKQRSFDDFDLDAHFYPRDLFKKKLFHSQPVPPEQIRAFAQPQGAAENDPFAYVKTAKADDDDGSDDDDDRPLFDGGDNASSGAALPPVDPNRDPLMQPGIAPVYVPPPSAVAPAAPADEDDDDVVMADNSPVHVPVPVNEDVD